MCAATASQGRTLPGWLAAGAQGPSSPFPSRLAALEVRWDRGCPVQIAEKEQGGLERGRDFPRVSKHGRGRTRAGVCCLSCLWGCRTLLEGGARALPEVTCLLPESSSVAGYLGRVPIAFSFYLNGIIII